VATTEVPERTTLGERVEHVRDLMSKAGGSILRLGKEGGGRMTLRLDPPSLGKLQVEVKVANGMCIARVIAEDPSVKAALTQGLPQLREALEAQGLKLDGFSVETQTQNSGTQGQGAGRFLDQQKNALGHGKSDDKNSNESEDDTKHEKQRLKLGVVDMHA
jgi:flagellar hook-length control protein FliK